MVKKRRITRSVAVGNVLIGSDYPIAVQSMTTIPVQDTSANVRQINELADLGCQIIRVAVPDRNAVGAIGEIVRQINLPVVADIHFNPRLALDCLRQGVAKIRLNPGTIRETEVLREIAILAREKKAAIRIGVNSGSVDTVRRNLHNKDVGHNQPKSSAGAERAFANIGKNSSLSVDAEDNLASRMAQDTLRWIDQFDSYGFHDLIVSVKASSVTDTIAAVQTVAHACDLPLHLGLTAAGLKDDAIVRSAIALSPLLIDGIGDTIRISITGDPHAEIPAAYQLLRECGRDHSQARLISCPTCGRTHGNLVTLARQVNDNIHKFPAGVLIAVMGCEVNGPGEASHADVGITLLADSSKLLLFVRGKTPVRINYAQALQAMLTAAEQLD